MEYGGLRGRIWEMKEGMYLGVERLVCDSEHSDHKLDELDGGDEETTIASEVRKCFRDLMWVRTCGACQDQ